MRRLLLGRNRKGAHTGPGELLRLRILKGQPAYAVIIADKDSAAKNTDSNRGYNCHERDDESVLR